MNNKGGFYIDVDSGIKQGVLERTCVYLNGKKVDRCVSAKSGSNGFVEFYESKWFGRSKHSKIVKQLMLKGSIPTVRKRGNVQIKIKPA